MNGFADKIFDFLETIFVRKERLRSVSVVKNNLEVDEIDTRFLSTCHTTPFPWPGNEVAFQNGDTIHETKDFTYLGDVVSTERGCDEDMDSNK